MKKYSPIIIKFINLFIIFFTLIYFFVSSEFKDYWYLKVIILLLIIICLGTPTTSIDSWFVYLFSGKVLFYESNLYVNYLDDNYLNVNNRPKLPATLSATFAQLLGYWNEIFPKSTNILVLAPALFVQCSFLKNNKTILLWLMFVLLISGRILVNGTMDGLVAMYFVTNCIIIYNLFLEEHLIYGKNSVEINKNKITLFFTGIFCGIILSLLKNEGLVIVILLLINIGD